MLNVSGETVCRLVELAQAFQARDTVIMPEDAGNPIDDPAGAETLTEPAAGEEDSSVAEFRTVIEDLEPDQQTEVVALMWLGRG